MVEQHARVATSHLPLGAVRTHALPRGSARLAQGMAHEKPRNAPKLSRAPGWTKDGYGAWETFLKRSRFLQAASVARPSLVHALHELAPLMAVVETALGAGRLTWAQIEAEVQVITLVGPDHSPLTPAAQPLLIELHHALVGWRAHYCLRATPTFDVSGVNASDWVLDAALTNLRTPGPTITAGVYLYTPPRAPDVPAVELGTHAWDASESAADWYGRTSDAVDKALRAHIEEVEAALRAFRFVPLPEKRTAGGKYLALAARWQVLGQDWEDFLNIERRPDGEERDPRLLRKRILEALRSVDIEPRQGMLSNPRT